MQEKAREVLVGIFDIFNDFWREKRQKNLNLTLTFRLFVATRRVDVCHLMLVHVQVVVVRLVTVI